MPKQSIDVVLRLPRTRGGVLHDVAFRVTVDPIYEGEVTDQYAAIIARILADPSVYNSRLCAKVVRVSGPENTKGAVAGPG